MPSSKYQVGTVNEEEELALPSGNLCLIRILDVAGLVGSGLINSLDELTAIVQTDHVNRMSGRATKKPTKAEAERSAEKQMMELLADEERFTTLVRTIDGIVVKALVAPEARMAPNEGQERTPRSGREWLYTDEIDFLDKTAIFERITGSSAKRAGELKPFRGESAGDVGALAESEVAPGQAG